jgi:5-methylcytosine-specific restriction protein A
MLTHERRCLVHMGQKRREYARTRQSSAAQGYGHEWRKASRQFRRDNPLCIECRKAGQLVAATVTDHIIPHKGDQKLFWNRGNRQALCARCH